MHCKLKRKCLSLCTSLEKEDTNLDYGTYYYADGDRRTDVMEVLFKIIKSTAANDFIIFLHLLGEPSKKIGQPVGSKSQLLPFFLKASLSFPGAPREAITQKNGMYEII